MNVTEWLASLGLGEHSDVFERERVDLEALKELNDAHLKELGIPLGHRVRMLKAIGQLGGDEGASAPTSAPALGVAAAGHDAVSAERRQLTVLFCDLVGSTALSTAIDAEVLRRVMADYHATCRGVIESYEGSVAQYLGDGVMAYFGWPVAHEDDTERALRAALELVDRVCALALPAQVRPELRTMNVRIGVATGSVVVGDASGSELGALRLAVGETPNLAARLQALAGPGTIVIAPATHQLAGPRFEYRDLGRHALKGIIDPVQAWEVRGLADTESRFEATRDDALTPLVGRQEELQAMLRRWNLALHGEAQVVLISGEPGIGKSRLAKVLREKVTSASGECLVLRYQCSPFHANSALHPVAEQLMRAAGFAREDDAARKLDRLDALLARTAPSLASDAAQVTRRAESPFCRKPLRKGIYARGFTRAEVPSGEIPLAGKTPSQGVFWGMRAWA